MPKPSKAAIARQIEALQKQRQEAWIAGDARLLKETELKIDALNRRA